MSPADPRLIGDFLAHARRRYLVIAAVQGAAIGLVGAALARLAGWPSRSSLGESILAGIALACAGAVLRAAWMSGRHRAIAILVEQRAPECRNLLVTAAELLAHDRGAASPPTRRYVDGLVLERAGALTRALDLSTLFPAARTLGAVVAGVLCWGASLALASGAAKMPGPALFGRGASSGIDAVDLTITPPPYTDRKATQLHDPSRIEALEGSRLHLSVHATASGMEVETLHGKQALRADGSGRFAGDLVVDADGFIAITATLVTGSVAPRRLIGVTAIPDLSPKVGITAPGRDLQFPDGHRTLELAIAADDDIALATLRLRYTKVSGSGERFSFTDGEIPIAITRTDHQHWSARAAWHLAAMGLEPGDMVVYRAVATDGRPGVAATESDSWIVEITAPGGIAASGFELDPEEARYAISQQMVILKTERLLARKNSITAEVFADSAAQLAAEQRKVRAEFVFMMGGEVADDQGNDISMTDLNEESEANGEGDLAAGRMVNAGRLALLRGIRHMSRAATGLTTLEVKPALDEERLALAEIEKAFSHSRIILRALTQHERLDFSRRLSGTLTDAFREAHASAAPLPAPGMLALRHALAGLATLAGSAASAADGSAQASALAQDVLRVDPSSRSGQEVAALLATASAEFARGRPDEARRALDRAATILASSLRTELPASPATGPEPELQRLRGAVVDQARHPGGRP